MFNFFDAFAENLHSIINFIINFFKGLVSFFGMIGSSITYIMQAIGYIPPFLIVFVTAIIGFSVILQIINHGG